jgi:hypothetical protein
MVINGMMADFSRKMAQMQYFWRLCDAQRIVPEKRA